jgi:glycerol-3-phosphate cytidylyltransferase
MKTVLTYGTYDLLHKGHVLLLERARNLGDRLIVGLSTDAFNELKGKRCFYSYEERYLILSAIRHVDMVIPEEDWEQKVSDIQAYDVDVFVMGDDWEGKFDYLTDYCEVVYLPRTENVSTTEIIEAIGRRQNGTAREDAAAREEGPAA